MSNYKFEIGDKVTVIDPGYIYSSYDKMAKEFGIKNWGEGIGVIKDKVYTVKGIKRHLDMRGMRFGGDIIIIAHIEDNEGVGYMMGIEGLETSDIFELEEELFLI